MGWVAEIDSRRKKFQLVSDRGYLDVYELVEGQQRHISPPEGRRTSLTPKQVCALLANADLRLVAGGTCQVISLLLKDKILPPRSKLRLVGIT